MEAKTLRFVRRGQIVSLDNVPPERTLLEVLREDLGATGTKEGCNEGDCGACTVVLGEVTPASRGKGEAIRYQAINSCIRLAHSVDGLALWTVEDLVGEDGSLHPAQEAMVRSHGSQCGFCTPGFVMSLFCMYQNHVCRGEAITRELAQEELSGNLCRCTGYRPILDAAQQMGELPVKRVDEKAVIRQLKSLRGAGADGADGRYLAPATLAGLLAVRAARPDAQIVAGCTDVGLWVTKMHLQFAQVLDVTRVEELRRIEQYENHISIGAAVTLTDAYQALAAERPQLKTFANRFAGLPVRNAGTLGGNVANGSPIGDSMPLLIALNAHVVLMSVRGHRELRLEDFYTGYRKTVLAADEVLAWIKVPRPRASPHPNPPPKGEGAREALAPFGGEREALAPFGGGPAVTSPSPVAGRPALASPSPVAGSPALASPSPVAGGSALASPSPSGGGLGWGQEFLRVYKISKRYDDDISAVCLALNMRFEQGVVASASIGAGGVAATPARAVNTEQFLLGKPWTQAVVLEAATVLRGEFQPIADMRASAGYRSEVLGNLLQRFWLESQGVRHINLEQFTLEDVAP